MNDHHQSPDLSAEQVQDLLRTLEAETARVARSQAEVERQLAMMRELLIGKSGFGGDRERTLEARMARVENAVQRVSTTVDIILESRIWKTLQAGGEILLRLGRARGLRRVANSAAPRLTFAEQHPEVNVFCDSLPVQPTQPLSGMVEIRGWALSLNGIDKVELIIDGGRPIPARYGLSRDDIGGRYPEVPGSRHCGFQVRFDSRGMEDGVHRAIIRTRTGSGTVNDLERPILIDQSVKNTTEYARWVELFDRPEPELVQLKMAGFTYKPLISILVPVFRTDPEILAQAIESVRKQSYREWELCLVDDGSGDPALSELLARSQADDARIRVTAQDRQSGISAASNRALSMATGEYVALLDHDDMLAADALFHVVDALQTSPRADMLYSDEDHMDEAEQRFDPFFKPDWSPDLILSENYICHLMVFRREIGLAVGGFRSQFDVSQDHDLVLRLSLAASRIVHIPRVLYHWRTTIDFMARASTVGDRVLDSSRRVIEAHLKESGIDGRVEEGLCPGRWRVRYPASAGARVSILIPSAGKIDILDRNLKALWAKAGQIPYEVVVIDNSKGQNNEGLVRFVERLQSAGHPVRRFDQRNEPFNYALLNNRAAATCQSPLLLFLNDDTEAISDDWVDALAELALREEIGAVGAKLLYPNGTIQHAGVSMGLAEICGHSFKGVPGDKRHYYDFPDVVRNVSAVTAACVMIRAEVFRQVNGFDSETFPIAYNDIDLCLRIGAAGYRNLYNPHAQLYHYEALSKSERELHPHPAETLALKTRWRATIERDPFYNPNLTRHKEDWSLRWD